ncbi:MAG: polysaccharide deacetylase family protein [Cellulomonas sp.]|uniref:polysaccharide deacetylase family protein n=1 Tax=Cellulomonas sp. 73-92 TaxID=1895740 RepID=UPI0009284ABA|nr:polysaccharide deacetylase family protein [Cellulomonas sp. 73-92]MBN9375607.1 polysaccharide deacetylase family protein [Cellulomonas sp.]OJV81555.1 MAG: cellulose-binding protein [Cellulomonas sp. 73-92]
MTDASQVTTARGTGRVAALTFDDGPNPGETDDLLDLLAETRITAVFCVIGANVRAPGGADVLRRTVAEGHVLANHTTSYADMGDWAADRVRADLVENLRIIHDAVGDVPVPYFRAPNGSWGRTAGVAAALGMRPLGLGNVIHDWETQDEETLVANLRAAIVPGAVVLAHDGGGERWSTVRAVRRVVRERLAEGWSFTLPGQ